MVRLLYLFVVLIAMGCSSQSERHRASDWEADQFYRKASPQLTKTEVIQALGMPDSMSRRVQTGSGTLLRDGKEVSFTDWSAEPVERLEQADRFVYSANGRSYGVANARYEFEWHGEHCVARVSRVKLAE